MEAKNSNKSPFITRVLIGIFLVFLAGLVSRSFYKSNFPYEITAGILVVLALMTVLVLSEAFNYFSVGKLLTLSREIESVTKHKDDLRQDNAELRKALLELSINVKQSQVNATINTNRVDFLESFGVTKADKAIIDKEQEEVNSSQHNNVDADQERANGRRRYRIRKLAEEFALNKYITENGISKIDVERSVQFSPSFENLDPIMDKNIYFNGYMKGANKEYFFEVRSAMYHSIFYDRLYVMLSKLRFYKSVKNTSVELILLLVNLDDAKDETYSSQKEEDLFKAFEPAIASGLLRIEKVKINSDEHKELNSLLEVESVS